MSAATYGVTINLNEGAFSTVAASGTNNIAIAFGTVIEDAKGGAYNDVLIGNGDDNVLTGGGGADVFGFGANWGHDTVTDFRHGIDTLDFSAAGLHFADLTITHSGGDTIVSHGSDSVQLLGVTTVDASDFVMA